MLNKTPALGLSFLLAALPVPAAAEAYTSGVQISVHGQTLPRCETPNGRAVTFVLSPSDAIPSPYAYSLGRGDYAPLMDGSIPQTRGNYIVIPQSFTTQSSGLLYFSVAHECAHHTLGHTWHLRDNWQSLTADEIRQSERAADCHAARSLMTDYGMDRDQAAATIRAAFSAPIIRNADEESLRVGTHDSAATRSNYALACLPS